MQPECHEYVAPIKEKDFCSPSVMDWQGIYIAPTMQGLSLILGALEMGYLCFGKH